MTRSLVFALAVGIVACGSAPPPEPAPPPAPPPAAEPAPISEAPEPAPEPPAEEPPAPRKAAKDVLLGEGWDFTLSFADSDVKAKATEECEKKTKGDEKKLSDCVAKAESDLAHDQIKFAKDDKDNWWFVSLGKVGGKDIVYSKIQVEVAKDEPDKLFLTPKGKDLGKKPIKKLPAELVIAMPDEYSVVFDHPDRGKLVYKVKVTGTSAPKPIEEPKPGG